MRFYQYYRYLVLLGMILISACGQKSNHLPAKSQTSDVAVLNKPVQSEAIVANLSGEVQQEISDSRQNAITRAVARLEPAVVGINVTQIREYVPRSLWDDPYFRYFFPQYRYRQEVKSLGSGFIISPDGYIVTNEHVVHGAVKVVVTLMEGKKYDAEIVGSDFVTDVALLKIKEESLPFCELGDSDNILIGEWVIAIGNPFGLFEVGQQPSVTVGVISSKNLNFGRQYDDRLYQGMIQTDASINPGNSGGPMANALGQVIGMNTFIFTGGDYSQGSIGLGFAIPINNVKEVVSLLKSHGKVDRQFWTGLEVEDLRPSVAQYFGLKNVIGVIVSNIETGSPADQAGLTVGDIIIEFNGQKISNTQGIWQVLNNMDAKAGDNISLRVLRQGQILQLHLKLGKVK